jgi:hypothetical protein
MWGIYMKEAQVQAEIAGIWGWVFGGVLMFMILALFVSVMGIANTEPWTGDGWYILAVISIIAIPVSVVLCANALINQYHWNANPEGRALQLLLAMLGI